MRTSSLENVSGTRLPAFACKLPRHLSLDIRIIPLTKVGALCDDAIFLFCLLIC